jgi:hypothetical protein
VYCPSMQSDLSDATTCANGGCPRQAVVTAVLTFVGKRDFCWLCVEAIAGLGLIERRSEPRADVSGGVPPALVRSEGAVHLT